MTQAESLAMRPALDGEIITFLTAAGLVSPGADIEAVPLTGGVASDIWKITGDGQTFVVKRALARLRVAQEWNVPVSRNASEVDWMLEAGRAVSSAVPRILAHDPAAGAFAMAYLDPARYPVWKEELRDGRIDPHFAAAVGRVLAAIHSSTADSSEVASRFATDATFHLIRLEPYLEATARAHPDLSTEILHLSERTAATRRVLVHGDVSPKNILVGPGGPVLLDAECAWFGEPAFDLAFCLNHLLLKCVWRPQHVEAYLASFGHLAAAYLAGVTWEPAPDVERRAAQLLPALLLARVDGKSPAEYIAAKSDKDRVRCVARALIVSPPTQLADVRSALAQETSR